MADSVAPRVDLSGVFVPSTTPFDPVTGELDVVGLRANLRTWLGHGVSGFVMGGSTGEAVLLDESERRAVWSATREVTPSDRVVVAGAGAESARTTLRLCRMAAESGADAVLIQPPSFYKGAMTPEVLARHYRQIADESPVPVVVYQVPLRLSTLDLSTGLIAELSHHENVIGVKDSRGSLDLVGELVEACADDFQVLVGSGAIFYAALEAGAVGGILAVAVLAAEQAVGIHTAVRSGRAAEAGRLQELVGPLHNAVVGGLGVPGVKAGLDLLGMRGGHPRPPLAPLEDEGLEKVRRAIERAGLRIDTPTVPV